MRIFVDSLEDLPVGSWVSIDLPDKVKLKVIIVEKPTTLAYRYEAVIAGIDLTDNQVLKGAGGI